MKTFLTIQFFTMLATIVGTFYFQRSLMKLFKTEDNLKYNLVVRKITIIECIIFIVSFLAYMFLPIY